MKKLTFLIGFAVIFTFTACKKDEEMAAVINPPVAETVLDPATTSRVSVDRFSASAGTLMIRDGANGLPTANTPINFDQAPFITTGHGPGGEIVEYYNFDVQSNNPAPIYVFFVSGSSTPVPGQLNVINVVPGDAGYNDFWNVVKVTVPSDYVANTVTSESEIYSKGYTLEVTSMIVNCPVVPEGSMATKRLGSTDVQLTMGWSKDKVVFYFNFAEAAIPATSGGLVSTSPIYVTFNVNPPTGGPSSGFVTEVGTMQTHNILATIPTDALYSPLWSVSVYDNTNFSMVHSLSDIGGATILGADLMTVNCPVVSVN